MLERAPNIRKPLCIHIQWIAIAVISLFFGVSCSNSARTDNAFYDSLKAQYKQAKEIPKRLQFAEQLDSLYHSTADPSLYFQLTRADVMSRYFYDRMDFHKAVAYLDTLIGLVERNNLEEQYPLIYGDALSGRGDYYFNEGQFDKAFDHYSRSKATKMKLGSDHCSLINESYHLGMVFYRQEKYLKAAHSFIECIEEENGCGTYDFYAYNRKQELYNNVGLSYSKINLMDSAAIYYKEALRIIDSEGTIFNSTERFRRLTEIARGVTYGNMAKVYSAAGNTDSAEHFLLRSLAINGRPGYEVFDATFSYIQLAELYYNTGRYEQAWPVLGNLWAALDTLTNSEVKTRWYNVMYKMNRHFNHHELAMQYLEQYHASKDSLELQVNNLKKQDYGSMLKDQETQYQINLLKKDNQYKKLYLGFSLGLGFIAVIIIVMVYDNYRRSKRNVLQLTSLNRQVNEQKTQLEDAMEQLKLNNEDKDKILRIVAHDLRTPIGGIMTLSDLMVEEETSPEKLESLNMIMSASKNLMHLTNELLEFSGNRSFATKIEKEDTDLNALAKQAVTLLQFKANEKHQNIVLHQAGDVVRLAIVREKINRVLNNLITNAIKFSKVGGVITVTVERTTDSVLVSVRDKGIGIPEQFISILFDPFTNAKRHGTQGERSFGLGLSICRQIMEDHGGRIWVESKEGEGSVFFVELPIN